MTGAYERSARERVRTALDDVVWRSLCAALLAALIVALAAATGIAGRAIEHAAAAGHGAAGHGERGSTAHAVTNEAGFLATMIPHHQEAVERATEALATTRREEVRDLAQAVIDVQAAEIAQLKAWLAAWYPEQGPVAMEPMMRPFVGLRPEEADQVFVADMIHHHEGAIEMATAYLRLRGEQQRPEVVTLAEEIVRTQRAEVAVLQLLLQMWGVTPADHDAH